MAINSRSKAILIQTFDNEELYNLINSYLIGEQNIDSIYPKNGYIDSGAEASQAIYYLTDNQIYGFSFLDYIVYDTNDTFGLWAITTAASVLVSGISTSSLDSTQLISTLETIISTNYDELPDRNDVNALDEAIKVFTKGALWTEDAVRTFFIERVKQRLDIWHNYVSVNNKWGNITDQDVLLIEQLEENVTSEELVNPDLLIEIPENISKLISLLYPNYNPDDSSAIASQSFINLAFSGRNTSSSQLSAFYRTFSNTNISAIESLKNASQIQKLFEKMETYGILELLSYANEIDTLATNRLQSTYTLGTSLDSFTNETTDIPWLTRLGQVLAIVRRDPIFFGTLQYYFPSIVSFILTATASVADYSDTSISVGEDTLNNVDDAIESIRKAFGVNSQGEPIFEMAASLINTAERIKAVLDKSPYRPNNPPGSPDIFHLRLGAANFYVPPISINVNTAFKTGSLSGAAIRQKNSAKFNSGYKETSIRIRLFFPNYEEIWGISIDDATRTTLNNNFQIDFGYKEDDAGNQIHGSSNEKIDKFLSSLRGLVAAFKYSPILPVKNNYLNVVHGITGVALSDMSISTIPNYPFTLVVDLELLNFNHKPFLPMIKDFNQAIHWGKYRHYMGKAAGAIHKYVNEEFLIKSSDDKAEDYSPDENTGKVGDYDITPYGASLDRTRLFSEEVFTTNVIREWINGNNITLYTPAESQTKVFLPDTSSFRSEQEKILDDLGSSFWQSLAKKIGLDINESSYIRPLSQTRSASLSNSWSPTIGRIIKEETPLLTAGVNSETIAEIAYKDLVEKFLQSNVSKTITNAQKAWLRDKDDSTLPYSTGIPGLILSGEEIEEPGLEEGASLNFVKGILLQASLNHEKYLDTLVETEAKRLHNLKGGDLEIIKQEVKEQFAIAYSVGIYERFFSSPLIQEYMEANRQKYGQFLFREWEVPMLRVDLNPKEAIVNAVSVNMGNNLVKLQLQMQDEPTYQHIGGRDTTISISMTVFGEKELMKIRRVFEHVSGLARLEHATGVLGFLGIKNIITALAGVKYVLPLNYSINTIPNFPHVYSVELSFVDFDIFQQRREELTSKQQADLIEHFKNKRNPFLRIKQLWGSFNAYPDFPLDIRDENNEIVGHLDPDYYFRSFEMLDDDVVNNIKNQTPKLAQYQLGDENGIDQGDVLEVVGITQSIINFLREYNASEDNSSQVLQEMVDFINSHNIDKAKFMSLLSSFVTTKTTEFDTKQKYTLMSDFIEFTKGEDTYEYGQLPATSISIGNVEVDGADKVSSIYAALQGEYSLPNDLISFDPDEVDFHAIIDYFPTPVPSDNGSVDPNATDSPGDKIPATLRTAIGNYYGHVNKLNGRFYFDDSVQIAQGGFKFAYRNTIDVQTPETGTTAPLTGVQGVKALSEYQNAYDGDVASHWEKMLADTKYRDVSGRMLRVFPTYMLWLIDEGGYFAGVKLFDNFYGLQSIIDFSVVSSEDLLGDTLIFRVSNLYSKLTRPESSKIFNARLDDYNEDPLNLQEGLENIYERTINVARNIMSGMKSEYIVDIKNIRLKPGVRVHLRAGYGSNPNSLQTLFNGVITEVQAGEIVTVTAQSDAIELGAVVNSTKEKGHSGKIDGGIDTGLWLSEPRDLMVRLLSMGTSRFREGMSFATQGTIFSENKFGIRHFGCMLYEPLTEQEGNKSAQIKDRISSTYTQLGSSDSLTGVVTGATSLMYNTAILPMMATLWGNYSAEVDLELFKRNIYPGNGTGIAQFLGGDLDDGWATVASYDPGQNIQGGTQDLEGYIGNATDRSWNRLLERYDVGQADAKKAIESLTAGSELRNSEGRANIVKNLLTGSLTVGAFAINPLLGKTTLGLAGVLSGRNGTNIFKTLGLVSGRDDDLPGFDEVSFRAQTYMRSVWYIFQTCAKMLPNYIVAVRPFEDRSTVFYGKPHWLYTSGVVPVTNGYPHQSQETSNVNIPQVRTADDALNDILKQINKNTNPLSDYNAYFSATETIGSLQSELLKDEIQNEGIYAPTAAIQGRLINFFSPLSKKTKIINSQGEEVEIRLPASKGVATIGPHLPIETENNKNLISLNSFPVNEIASIHKQIPTLLPQYSFPFFVDLNDEQYLPYSPIFDKDFFKQNKGYTIFENLIKELPEADNITSDSDLAPVFDKQGSGINEVIQQELQSFIEEEIRMPYPDRDPLISDEDDDEMIPEWESLGDPYSDWGLPRNATEEQFYIAMRWPYVPTEIDGSFTKEKFTTKYFPESVTNSSSNFLSGTAEDYKNSRVLVFNPATGAAVVCAPMYFLWSSGSNISNNQTNFEADGNYGVKEYSLIEAVVSPDAAQILGITFGAIDSSSLFVSNVSGRNSSDWNWNYRYSNPISGKLRDTPGFADCLYAFVPNTVPLGVISKSKAPATFFKSPGVSYGYSSAESININDIGFIIGFGSFAPNEQNEYIAKTAMSETTDAIERYLLNNYEASSSLEEYKPSSGSSASYSLQERFYGGNVLSNKKPGESDGINYFKAVINGTIDSLDRDKLYEILDAELDSTGDTAGSGRKAFVSIFDPLDEISISARKYYDESYDNEISVIAGDGRTLTQASDIWDQFRFGYHTYESVKAIFYNTYNIDPDLTEEFPQMFKDAILGQLNTSPISSIAEDEVQDQFKILLGEDFFQESPRLGRVSSDEKSRAEALEFARKNFLSDAPDGDGVIAYYNKLISSAFSRISEIMIGDVNTQQLITFSLDIRGNDEQQIRRQLAEKIKSPKQLFLFMVGVFRQKMWSDPYNRAWLVLKPNRKLTGAGSEGQWDFKPVDKIFQAFIDPYDTYAKDPAKFKKLLISTASEGRSSTNIFGVIGTEVKEFYKATVGNMFKGIADALGGLMSMFKMSMLQMGFALSEVGKFSRQANILNKALNDSIYYSLGRPGSLLRAVDNPFTREYGEPVIEVREPFQRIHYLSSFSHIVSNRIQENLNGVSTVITAVSDGKYPVTVALDKGAPAERQVEKTIETGIYYDNFVGSGFLGFLHPLMHPISTIRGVVKNVQGAPDELIARRIGLGHLRESIKDIYTGELIILGNGDIRPHDLIYLADIYERMYGIFEVEQVVHHFTPELGYITSITPNALVTVNDPARWFMTTWIHSWLSTQNTRNDTRIMVQNIQSGNSGLVVGNGLSLEAVSEALMPQLLGSFQYTHGSSALAKDMMAYESATALPGYTEGIAKLADDQKAKGGVVTSVIGLTLQLAVGGATVAAAIGTGGAALAGTTALGAAGTGLAAAVGGASLVGSLAWSGWKWVRDNLLDQHGCYVQYLNKNGQPMDAGLSYNQGMVVGKYHSKALLPGILGVRANVRTENGYSHIRTDDLMKSLGWRETEIKDFVRYASYENALANARVLSLSGLGPEKAGMGMYFKVLCRAINFIDGDTIDVEDIITGNTFRVRFDGIDTAEINTTSVPLNLGDDTVAGVEGGSSVKIIQVYFNNQTYMLDGFENDNLDTDLANSEVLPLVEDEVIITTEENHNLLKGQSVAITNLSQYSGTFYVEKVLSAKKFTVINFDVSIENPGLNNLSNVTSNEILRYVNTSVPSGKAKNYTKQILENKIFILRINPTRVGNTAILEEQYEPGNDANTKANYLNDSTESDRVIATIFHYLPETQKEAAKAKITSIFYETYNANSASIDIQKVKNVVKDSFYDKSAFYTKFNEIYRACESENTIYWESPPSPSLVDLFISQNSRIYNSLVKMKILEQIYLKASEWPLVLWDEYYEDGYPVTFNWELVVNNLASPYIKGIQVESSAVLTANEMGAPIVRLG